MWRYEIKRKTKIKAKKSIKSAEKTNTVYRSKRNSSDSRYEKCQSPCQIVKVLTGEDRSGPPNKPNDRKSANTLTRMKNR